jgi:hypothetical protein
MPHFGQLSGLSLSTPGHIGQMYFADPCDDLSAELNSTV